MAEGLILPYLDIPFQHSHPDVLRRMARPAAGARTLDEIARWRAACPDLVLRSTFIVGYPGETEAEFQHLLDWLDAARLDRVGCFQLRERQGRPRQRPPRPRPRGGQGGALAALHGRRREASAPPSSRPASAPASRSSSTRSTPRPPPAARRADAPEIDGNLFIDEGFSHLRPGDRVTVTVEEADDYDLWGRI